MKRKTMAILLALSMVFGLSACTKQTDISNKKADSGSGDQIESGSEKGNKEVPRISTDFLLEFEDGDNNLLSIANQLQTIVKNSGKWRAGYEFPEDMSSPWEFYAVTDLDQNGRLEILSSTGPLGNKGNYSFSTFYQINKQGDQLEHIKKSFISDSIVNNINSVYCDAKNVYHYETYDFEPFRANTITLKNGKLIKKTFSDEKARKKKYKGQEELPVHIKWIEFTNDVEDMEEEQILYYLCKSYRAFTLGNAAINAEAAEEQEDNLIIPYEDIDWDEYQYMMKPKEYQGLYEYLPVLTGSEPFQLTIWEEPFEGKKEMDSKISYDGKEDGLENNSQKSITMWEMLKTGGADQEKLDLNSVVAEDLTGDGNQELILIWWNTGKKGERRTSILHQENGKYYCLMLHYEICVYKSGVYEKVPFGFADNVNQIGFKDGEFVEKKLAEECENGKEALYYLNGELIDYASFMKYYRKKTKNEAVRYYSDEIGG